MRRKEIIQFTQLFNEIVLTKRLETFSNFTREAT